MLLPVLLLVVLRQGQSPLPTDAPTVAQEVRAVEPPSAPVPMSPVRFGAVGLATTTGFVASFTAGIYVSTALLRAQFVAHGRPDPFATGSALVGGFATTVLLSQLLVPAATLLGNEGGAAGTLEAAWFGGWKRARWAFIAGVVSSAVFYGGVALENQEFGRGQELLLAGGIGLIGATVVYGVLDVTGAISGYAASRTRRTPSVAR